MPVLPPAVALARTCAAPAADPQRAVTASPLVVTTETVASPFCENVPKSVEKETPVPSGTGLPFRLTRASMSVQFPALGLASLVKSWMVSPPAFPPPPPPPPGGGPVGASAAQP